MKLKAIITGFDASYLQWVPGVVDKITLTLQLDADEAKRLTPHMGHNLIESQVFVDLVSVQEGETA